MPQQITTDVEEIRQRFVDAAALLSRCKFVESYIIPDFPTGIKTQSDLVMQNDVIKGAGLYRTMRQTHDTQGNWCEPWFGPRRRYLAVGIVLGRGIPFDAYSDYGAAWLHVGLDSVEVLHPCYKPKNALVVNPHCTGTLPTIGDETFRNKNFPQGGDARSKGISIEVFKAWAEYLDQVQQLAELCEQSGAQMLQSSVKMKHAFRRWVEIADPCGLRHK